MSPGLLPPQARQALRRAAATPIPKDDPFARSRAINRAIERLRAQYPEFFKPDNL